MALQQNGYPVQLSVDYPDRPLNRTSTFFRLIAIIPTFIVLTLVSSSSVNMGESTVAGAGGAIVIATALMILFRQKYPR